MDPNNRFKEVLNDVLGLDDSDSLLFPNDQHNEESDGGYGDGPNSYLSGENENLSNILHEEMNMSNQAEQENESLGISSEEEFDICDEGDLEDDENPLIDENFTEEQYMGGPVQGMTFASVESLFAFYKEHSRLTGFAIIRKSTRKNLHDEHSMYLSFACDKGGKSTPRKLSKRVDCKAKVNCKVMYDGQCVVTRVVTDHNHSLEPALSRFFRCHRQLSRTLKRRLEANDIAGLRPSKSIRLLEVEAGGPHRIGCTPKDCRNYILQQRRMRTLSSDAAAIGKFFADMQVKDGDFFYSIDTDRSARLRNVVWVHTHCKYAYKEFNDVVCFDTTYLVNQWRMPFASFIGVNQHRQSILLGCALLTSKDIETYKFVFSIWLAAMDNAPPTTIITDQCESIKAAIREVLPDTIHRYCIWHIMTKLPARLKGVSDYKAAKSEFKSIIFNSITIIEFEEKWAAFIEKYELEERQWFRNLHSERQSWVPVFLKHYFWAGMMSTQRCESMHAFFDGYINGRSSLKQFVEQYEIALRYKYEKELHAEAESRKTNSPPFSGFDWERQIQAHYTRTMYDIFVEQLKRLYHCEIVEHADSGRVEGVEKFSITDYSVKSDFHGNQFVYTVEYRPDNQYLECNCKNFESEGIICCHILRTMSIRRINHLHERYILRRWRRDVPRPHLLRFFPGGYPTMTDEYKKYNSLKKWFDSISDVVLDNNTKYLDFKRVLKDRFNAYSNWNDDMAFPSVGDPDSDDDATFIRNPREVRSRGRPQMSRNRSVRDNIFRRGGRQRNTTYHDAVQEGENSHGRRGGGRRGGGRRGGRRMTAVHNGEINDC